MEISSIVSLCVVYVRNKIVYCQDFYLTVTVPSLHKTPNENLALIGIQTASAAIDGLGIKFSERFRLKCISLLAILSLFFLSI